MTSTTVMTTSGVCDDDDNDGDNKGDDSIGQTTGTHAGNKDNGMYIIIMRMIMTTATE